MKTKLRIISFLLAIVMCLSMLVACGSDDKSSKKEKETTEEATETKKPFVKKDPTKDPHGAIAGAFTLLGESYAGTLSDISNVINKASSDKGTYNLAFSYDGTDFSLDTVVDSKKSKSSSVFKIGLEGFSTKANIWTGDDVIVEFPALLGDTAYGVKIETFLEDLEKSDLLEMMGYDDADEFMDDMLGDSLGSEGFNSLLSVFDSENSNKASEKLHNALSTAAHGITPEVTAEKIEGKDGYKITFDVTPENVRPFVEAYYDYVEDLYGDYLEYCGVDVDDSREEALESLDEVDEGKSISINVYLYKDSGKLAKIETYTDNEEDLETGKNEIKLDFTADSIVFSSYSFSDGDYGKHESSTNITYKLVNKDGKRGFEFSTNDSNYSYYYDDGDEYNFESESNASFLIDKDGNFTFKAKSDGDEVLNVKGNLKYDNKSVTLGISSIKSEGSSLGFSGTLTVTVGGTVTKAPKYTNILEMTEDDFEDLIETMESSVLFGAIEDMYNEPASPSYEDNYYEF